MVREELVDCLTVGEHGDRVAVEDTDADDSGDSDRVWDQVFNRVDDNDSLSDRLVLTEC